MSGVLVPMSFLVLLAIVLSRLSPHFATRDNLKQLAVQAAAVAILACGQTAVIIAAEIDLSVGSIFAFSGVAAALAMTRYHQGALVGVLVACVAGLALGTVNGLITAYGRIPSFIVTLGAMGIWRGAAGLMCNSQDVGGMPERFLRLGVGELFGSASRDGIPYAVVVMACVALAMHAALSRTRWGRADYAMGGNREAARLSGINMGRMLTSVFAVSGLLCGAAAVLNVARTTVASKDAGLGLELYAIAATVLGGTSLFGGEGGIPGAIIGAFLIFTIHNGCDLLGYGTDVQDVVIGAVIILAVLYDRYAPGHHARKTG